MQCNNYENIEKKKDRQRPKDLLQNAENMIRRDKEWDTKRMRFKTDREKRE